MARSLVLIWIAYGSLLSTHWSSHRIQSGVVLYKENGGQNSNGIGSEAAFCLPERGRCAIENSHVGLPVSLPFSASFSPQIKDAEQRWTALGMLLSSRHAKRSHC